ncbi:MAG: AI-2E family transporter [Bombilactobacillus mellifer]|uniref:AI-2E family transporter n=1 Tax=Bombilactobacillus mellifer TaxID=1218492 RepID=UPI0023F40B6F|nr:AI-2E family transporter [Bombilactobacillus mellifer]MCT6826877.1 AI-2E family transporter [Bombilactobacillus mellifer]MCT6843836.1 AI-2E family transporter [Bombilactobacillus mellifer]MCT6894732.1 AI-2E family transporter [Bombilactobacillus mellifer]
MTNNKKTWFTNWFLNNKFTVVLLNILLLFVIIALFGKVNYFFRPLGQILGIILPPLVVAGILYYLIDPLIDWLEAKFNIPRVWSISIVFILIFGLLIWMVVTLIPIIQSQINSLIHNIPSYWRDLQGMLNELSHNPRLQKLHLTQNFSTTKINHSLAQSWDGVLGSAFNNLTSAVGIVSNVVMILLTAPFVLFFMLKDDRQIKPLVLKYVPDRLKASIGVTLTEINGALSSYIRGQLTVAFWVAVMFAVGYLIAQVPYALLLGITAGFLNLIPYVGSALGLIPAIILALINGHGMIWSVIIVFAIEQTIETRVVSPLVVGNKMNMHPVTTIFVLLVSGGMFGLAGVIFGIPIFAILKIICSRIFKWFQRNSNWYQNGTN